MRIRKSAARLLGCTYSTTPAAPPLRMAPPVDLMLPPPPPQLHPCFLTEPRGGDSSSSLDPAFGKSCELNRSAWDLIAELSISDPEVEDDLMDKYFVHVTTRASWLFSPTVPAIFAKKKKKNALKKKNKKQAMADGGRVQLQSEYEKKSILNTKVKKHQKGGQVKNTKVKKKDHKDGVAKVWNCKRNDGKKWQCKQKVSHPDSLCDYHFMLKCSHSNPGFGSTTEQEKVMMAPRSKTSKSSTSSESKPQKMKFNNDFNAMEGFYYYDGFGFRNKRHYRSSVDDYVPIKQKEEYSIKEELEQEQGRDAMDLSLIEVESHDNETNQTAVFSDDITGTTDIDEDSSDDDYNGISTASSSMTGNGATRASNGGSKRKIWRKKKGRKPMKARSLMSLM